MTPRQKNMLESRRLKRSKKGPATSKERRRAIIRGTTVTELRKQKTKKKEAKKVKKAEAARKRAASRRSSRSKSTASRTSTSTSGISRWAASYKK